MAFAPKPVITSHSNTLCFPNVYTVTDACYHHHQTIKQNDFTHPHGLFTIQPIQKKKKMAASNKNFSFKFAIYNIKKEKKKPMGFIIKLFICIIYKSTD